MCTQGTNAPVGPSTSNTFLPMRVIRRILTTTYGESDNSTPICAIGEPSGPIENGITYIVRPTIAPSNNSSSLVRISAGSIQLLVGPASDLFLLQINVRSSTRATSSGDERARNEFGRFAGFSLCNIPDCTISAHRRSYSSCEPSHQTILAGLALAAMSPTHFFNSAW